MDLLERAVDDVGIVARRVHQVGVQLADRRFGHSAAHIGDVLAPALPSVAGRRHAGAGAGAVHAGVGERIRLVHPCAVSVSGVQKFAVECERLHPGAGPSLVDELQKKRF